MLLVVVGCCLCALLPQISVLLYVVTKYGDGQMTKRHSEIAACNGWLLLLQLLLLRLIVNVMQYDKMSNILGHYYGALYLCDEHTHTHIHVFKGLRRAALLHYLYACVFMLCEMASAYFTLNISHCMLCISYLSIRSCERATAIKINQIHCPKTLQFRHLRHVNAIKIAHTKSLTGSHLRKHTHACGT